MSTALFNSIVFGPVKSRRLGLSLGINLLPAFGKWCSFDCLYCECGWNKDGKDDKRLPLKEEVRLALENALITRKGETESQLDTITFSGNGEPTMHPDFAEIIDYTIKLRNQYSPKTKISVLTNGSQINKPRVREALLKIDNAIIKLDSAFDSTVMIIDRPLYNYNTKQVIKNLIPFKHQFVLQTMFIKGEYDGVLFDNTTPEEINGWYRLIDLIEPREIMIYTIDRDTPAHNISKLSIDVLNKIAAPIVDKGYKVIVAG